MRSLGGPGQVVVLGASSVIASDYVADRLKNPGRVGWGEGVE
jgi:hypothetical protein